MIRASESSSISVTPVASLFCTLKVSGPEVKLSASGLQPSLVITTFTVRAPLLAPELLGAAFVPLLLLPHAARAVTVANPVMPVKAQR